VGFVLLCVLLPVLANGARAYGIIMLAHLTNNRIAVGVDHQIYGWLFFGVVMYPLFTLGARWREEEVHWPRVSAGAAGVPWSARAVGAAACCGVLLLAMGPAAAWVWSAGPNQEVAVEVAATVSAPSVRPPWRLVDGYPGDWKTTYRGPAAELTQVYRSGSADVGVYIGYYLDEEQGAELVNSENQVVRGKGWFAVREEQRSIVVDSQVVRARETVLRSSQGTHRVVWSWYWVADEFTSIDSYAKFLQAKAKLFGEPTDAAVVAITSAYDPDSTQPTHLLQDFLDHCEPWRETLKGYRAS
jgi:EpsI family protein